ncbi:hypothetical protein XthCFBP4691_00480 [Xanthomonas theicola]|uniref:T6SS Phospholipase effector Tle1-like catalytic domain-containing protein n=1 Tax=Xanthomonas theicola TaxID=56464 RepID=A0A2S6ZME5_9XANT|nr:hypothetical protein XthCFBP4691_00480 [Xanthomonas theicola]QNH27079.1 DUF2235 domain-containing protein [Xanthomonas theicola]
METYPASQQDLAIYEQSRHALAQFQAPRLVSDKNPHSRLFVASFDGTGNDKYKDPEHITNIGILDDQVKAAQKSGMRNIGGHYVPGVGTQDDPFTQAIDGGLGYSYGPRMEEMYLRFVRQAKEWQKQDPHAEISILSTGFSRGAVTTAMFTRMVDERGIQDPEGMQIDYGPAGEVRQLTATRPPLAPPGRTAQAVALLDPVATGDMNLRDVRLPPSVVSGLQISARDERRDAFPVKDILDPGRSRDGRFLDLVNPGAHSDIGGSYRLDGLAVRNGNPLAAQVNPRWRQGPSCLTSPPRLGRMAITGASMDGHHTMSRSTSLTMERRSCSIPSTSVRCSRFLRCWQPHCRSYLQDVRK